ncbi:hypothetical protein [Sphingomonas solaris]|uniref:Glycine zipper domain-containing protein n=1 Tax=Alterirhizorhabdus solaris TaxID=2529389 RepID=A0A558QZF5_9SPHN|nr:hypothetical protein [Sphingomonas solaris]TVV72468.1 hypothetical protein FOY91_14470 [Sphingomonas solaris]
MKNLGLFAGLAAMSMAFAVPANAQSAGELLKGGAIGGAGGAVAGAVIPGLSTGNGALLGAGAGLAVTALSKNKKTYRDNRGRKYTIDKRGYRRYK